jgi:hypothetical protein
MNRLFTLAVLAVLVVAPAASAQEQHPASKASVTVSTPIVVGTTTLSPGRYRFECKEIEGKHVMVISREGKEVARVACTPVPLDSKVAETGYRTVLRGDAKVLTEIRIKGQTVAHTLVP